MNLTVAIESAELRFKQILEDFFFSVFDERSLSSHGIDHHRRVWCYSKELLFILKGQDSSTIGQLTSKLIIACYLHDIGMSVEPGIRHGKESMDLCIQFLNKNYLPVNDFQDVLHAIENHDIKEYDGNTGPNDILSVLSVADDLDAFGFTGIFRYLEVYLTRKIDLKSIGIMIRENAGNRFDNFVKAFGFNDEFVQKHKIRYEILDKFFNEYNIQVSSYNFELQHPSGYCGVVELHLLMITNNRELKDLLNEPDKYSNDPVILWFFEGLRSDLS